MALPAYRFFANDNSISTAPSRRAVIGGSLAALAAASLPAQSARSQEKRPKRSGLMAQPQGVDLLQMRCKCVLELDGELRIVEPDPEKDAELRKGEVKAKSTLDYFENVGFQDDQPYAASRRYVTAKNQNWVSGNASTLELRPDCSDTRVLPHAGTWQQYCPGQPLDAREVDLLQSPINTLALELLLPAEPAKADQPWDISKEAAKNLFNLEAVHQSSLTAKIVKVEKGVATVEFSGNLDATANSVSTKLDIRGNFQAKLGTQCAIVSWLGLVIKEERAISQAEPGFSITARIRLIREETSQGLAAGEAELRKIAKSKDDARWLIRLRSIPGRYDMLVDRRWTTYIDGGEEAILRMIENNSVIAQCNITQLTSLDEGTQLTLEGLQADIRKSHGDSFREFLASEERVTASKLRLMRLVVAGELEEVPIQWIYNHLSDDSGRRLALEFTMGGNYVERFAAADEQMSGSLTFLAAAPPTTDGPTPAPQVGAKQGAASRR